MNLVNISKSLGSLDKDEIVKWAIEKKLLPSEQKCKSCKQDYMIIKWKNGEDTPGYPYFYCRNCHSNVSILKNTWFEKTKVPLVKILIICYCFARDFTYEQSLIETSICSNEKTSRSTICDWFNFCRLLCQSSLDRLYDKMGLIGGKGRVVQIDETKVGSRKNNKGRFVEGKWILGMIDLNGQPGDLRLEVLPNNKRDSSTLKELIFKHVKKGSLVKTDDWKAYNFLKKYYNHKKVNHSKNLILKH